MKCCKFLSLFILIMISGFFISAHGFEKNNSDINKLTLKEK
jgi:hypothetical protein